MDIGAVGAAGAGRFQPIRPTGAGVPGAAGEAETNEAPGFSEMLEDALVQPDLVKYPGNIAVFFIQRLGRSRAAQLLHCGK